MTRTEEFVYNLCNKTFLSLWSFPNPLGKKNKELCDVLIVCEPDIIIFSVKEINIKSSGNIELDSERWIERAITSSAKQIYGAERFIKNSEKVILKDKTEIEISQEKNWKIHRIAVGFGRGEKYPIKYGDLGNGFVHFFDENTVQIILRELDTTKDFTNYLQQKEKFIIESLSPPFSYREEDIIAYYLLNNFSFPYKGDLVILESDLYPNLKKDEEYLKIIDGLKVSYIWDKLIEKLIEDFNTGQLINDVTRSNLELTIRQMARETRNSRKILSEQFLDFIGFNYPPKVQSRLISSDKMNVIYLFLLGEYSDREMRQKELQLRSFVARSMFDCPTVVGLATEKYTPKGYSLDYSYLSLPTFTEEDKKDAKAISEELGYFNKSN